MISVIIVTWNCRDLIGDCLDSIDRETHRPHEVIVVDNASADGTPELVRERYPEVIVIESGRNRGFAAGCNLGLERAAGDYLLLLNPDTVVRRRAIDVLAAHLDRVPAAGIAGGKAVNGHGAVCENVVSFPRFFHSLVFITFLGRWWARNKLTGVVPRTLSSWTVPQVVPCVNGSFMMARRKAYEQVGGLDERFFMYFEESDWCRRFGRAGWTVWYVPEAEILHIGGGCGGPYQERLRAEMYRSAFLYFEKYGGRSRARLLALWLVFTFRLRARWNARTPDAGAVSAALRDIIEAVRPWTLAGPDNLR